MIPWNKGKKLSEEHKKKIAKTMTGKPHVSEQAKKRLSEIHKGEKNPMWKGNNLKYQGIHYRIKTQLSKPELCEKCKLVPPYDLANISGKYLYDLTDWQYLCRKCHMNLDKRILNLKQYSGYSSCAVA